MRDRDGAFGSDGGERVAVAVLDRDLVSWRAEGFVEKYELGSDSGLLVPRHDVVIAARDVYRRRARDNDQLSIPDGTFPLPALWGADGPLEHVALGNLPGDVLTQLGVPVIDRAEFVGNLLVNQGIQRFEDLLIAVAVQGYDNTHCRLGVGNSATAAGATDTDLTAAAGSGNRQFVVMDATFPSRASQTLSFKATHTTGLSNFAWQEWMIDNGTANGTTVTANALNHKVTSLGTKTSAASWAFTVTVVLS